MELGARVLVCLCLLPLVFASCKKFFKNKYTVTTTTGKGQYAGTDDYIYIKILMEKDATDWYNLDDILRDDFLAGETNEFSISSCQLGKIHGFILKLEASCVDAWLVKQVKVNNKDWKRTDDHVTCQFNDWMNDKDYSACVSGEHGNANYWYRKLKEEGYFEGERKIDALRVGDNANSGCIYWLAHGDSYVTYQNDAKNENICRTKEYVFDRCGTSG